MKLDAHGDRLRPGAAYFLQPDSSQQRRYEALRAYFVDDLPASQVADRYGYSTASVHQMATLLRAGKLKLFAHTKPGPKGPRKATGELRTKILRLRAQDHSVTEIAHALTADGLPVSAQTVWQLLAAEGLPRLPRRDEGRRGSPARLDPVKATKLTAWPTAAQLPCDHAGLLLLFPAMADLGLHDLVRKASYPSTTALSAWQSIASLLLAKCARRPRIHHLGSLTDDAGLAFALGLSAIPKATHLGSYSYRVRRQSNQQLLTGLVGALRPLGLATGEAGFNLDFHAIRHHGDDTMLERHYVPRRSQRTRAVLTFFAQDHTSAEMVYANADITKTEQAREIIAFADYWQQATGADPGLLISNDQASPAIDLFGRYAERMLIENELDAYIAGFHLDALSSAIPLNVDLDTTLTVIAGNLYRLLGRRLPRYQTATPDKLWRHFLDTGGSLHITDDQVTCALNLRSYHPVLIDGGFADLEVPIPWWQGRTLRFRFPPR